MTNRRLRLLSLLAAAMLLVGGACSDDDNDDAAGGDEGGDQTTTSQDSSTEVTTTPGVTLTAALSGAEEVPGPGVDDGVGTAEVRLDGEQVCYVMNVTMGETPTAGHIHEAAKGVSGPVVVDLKPTFEPGESAFTAEGCAAPPNQELLARIGTEPAAFYVNVHTAEHPNGAVRGQLALQ
ncbi:MAG TPA: CHRD domain-containing protein [Acidimicrobiia bacterium]|nr:CHRD domain-containing protein [Acidimicrobiia bacterium]